VGVAVGVSVEVGVPVSVGVEVDVDVELGPGVDVRVGVAEAPGVGVTVMLPVGVGLIAPTLITTVNKAPKGWLLSSMRVQTPVNLPVLLGTFMLTEISVCPPTGTAATSLTFCPPICSP
jgi:hypothetical protein